MMTQHTIQVLIKTLQMGKTMISQTIIFMGSISQTTQMIIRDQVITTFMMKIALVSISILNNHKFATLMIILCTILISMMTTVMLTTGASENMIQILVHLYLQMVGLNMKQCKSSQLFTGAQCT